MRTRNPLIQLLKQCLPEANPIAFSESDDMFAWKVGELAPVQKFPTAATWKYLHPPGESVSWHKQVWFSGHIPKHAFLTWVNVRHRLTTRDRMRRWGLQVPASCVLCSSQDESHQHLFFDCSYSDAVWSHFMVKLNLQPPRSFDPLLSWLTRPSSNSHLVLIIRFIYQASKYAIWRERNSRIHSSISRPPEALISEIKDLIRLRLDPLSRSLAAAAASSSTNPSVSLMATWLSIF
ncbi:uncharacterized protein LOC108837688 [Raphanus sativus]|uniref:Uncharacterized protein LOC108837688 n=1 Tax=Raphanus sativus TaxID=3726 RepID=A0A6J0M2C0_RAPSA|nr:uncharacterized protein LOC108837688 [Raphanus sativus]